MQKQRARSDHDKGERRDAILAAALASLRASSFAEIKLTDVAARAGLAKGTLFLYFSSKEALFLGVLEQLLDDWFRALDAALMGGRGRWTAERLATTLVETIAPREPLTHLLTLHGPVLEHNVDLDTVVRFKTNVLAWIARTGALIETRLPDLAKGTGPALFMRVYAVVVGTRQLADAAPVARQALLRPELAALRVDFATELAVNLTALVRGLTA